MDRLNRPSADAYRSLALALATTEVSRRLEALAVRVVRELEAAGIPCLVLRGPVFSRWLYEDVSERPYDDVDVLVPAAEVAAASEVVLALGLSAVLGGAASSERAPHASTFEGRDGYVDLHWTLRGIAAEPAVVWAELSRERELSRLEDGLIPVPRPAARAFISALHAAQHRRDAPLPLEDLRRIVERLPRSGWGEATATARRLDALPAFASGLQLVPEGAELLRELGVQDGWTLDLAVRAEGELPMIRGLSRLAETPGLLAKLRLLARELFPTPVFMREWSPLARRGGIAGLVAAYALRPLWMARHIGPALRAYRRARRRTG
jgi:hypothetical protein